MLSIALRKGLDAARVNLLPGLVLQAAAAALLLGYWYSPGFAGLLNRIATFKQETGFLFSAISTPIAAVVFPMLLQRLTTHRVTLGAAGWVILLTFWAQRGVEVDAFYRLQAWLFGNGADLKTIAAKVALDQFVYVPIWAVASQMLVYRLAHRKPLPGPGPGRPSWGQWWLGQLLPTMIANQVVWIPAVAIIYALPLPLQLPIANLVMSMWLLIFTFLVREDGDA